MVAVQTPRRNALEAAGQASLVVWRDRSQCDYQSMISNLAHACVFTLLEKSPTSSTAGVVSLATSAVVFSCSAISSYARPGREDAFRTTYCSNVKVLFGVQRAEVKLQTRDTVPEVESTWRR